MAAVPAHSDAGAPAQAGPPVDAVGGNGGGRGAPGVGGAGGRGGERDPGSTHSLGFFVRKEAKSHGLGRRVEGGLERGQSVALLEDTVTTGGSTLEALEAVEAAGGKVSRVLCLVDRGEGAREAFATRGIELEALYGRDDLPV